MAGAGVTRPPNVTEPHEPSPRGSRFGGSPLTPSSAKRIAAFGSLVVILFGVLVVRLWFLQVVGARDFEEQAIGNSIRTINIPAPRGRILDRNGVELAGTREAWDIVALPQDLEDADHTLSKQGSETLGRVARAIGVPKVTLRRMLVRGRKKAAYKSVVLKADIDDELRIPLTERISELPGIRIEKTFRRSYPEGATLGHVLGWVGPITENDIDTKRRQGYRNDAIVGRSGLELRYEDFLRGVDGERKVEVDASGQPVPNGRGSERPPKPGNDLQTTIDINVQRAAEEALRERVEFSGSLRDKAGGGVVVMEAETGEIVALASYPQIDPRVYTKGRRKEVLAIRKNPRQPEIIRPLWAYPPASTFKPVTAVAALNAGFLRSDEFLTSPKSVKLFGQTFNNFRNLEQPDMTVTTAIAVSSDTFFYQVGAKLWSRAPRDNRSAGETKLRQWALDFGLGRPTGIDIPGEYAGVVPDREWKAANVPARSDRFYNRWLPGDTINMSIGQGFLAATPLQMARAYAALINERHAVLTPTIGRQVTEAGTGRVLNDVQAGRPETLLPEFNAGVLDPVIQGLENVTNTFEGTGAPVFGGLGGLVAGKTGTAETGKDRDHAWFVGYGPASLDSAAAAGRKYVVAVVIEYSGVGGQIAAPVACRTLAPALGYESKRCGNGTRRTTVAD